MAKTDARPEPSDHKLAMKAKALIWEKGHKALEMAQHLVLEEKMPSEQLQAAVEYFMSSWKDAAHPALLALSCEAVGGNPDSTTEVGVAYVLLAGGADIHDDIIDDSAFKYSRKTVLGKFGKNIAILAGDALLFRGFFMLQKALDAFSNAQKKVVFELTEKAFFGISSAETAESILREKSCTPPAEEYLKMIESKAAVSEATARIGAVLGEGTADEAEILGDYGRAIGILLAVRDEFIDVFDLDELKNRIAKECLPLPILFALKNSEKADEIMGIIKKAQVTKRQQECLVDKVVESKETQQLIKYMKLMVKKESAQLRLLEKSKIELSIILKSTIEDI